MVLAAGFHNKKIIIMYHLCYHKDCTYLFCTIIDCTNYTQHHIFQTQQYQKYYQIEKNFQTHLTHSIVRNFVVIIIITFIITMLCACIIIIVMSILSICACSCICICIKTRCTRIIGIACCTNNIVVFPCISLLPLFPLLLLLSLPVFILQLLISLISFPFAIPPPIQDIKGNRMIVSVTPVAFPRPITPVI